MLVRYAIALGRGRHRHALEEGACRAGLEIASRQSELLAAVATTTPRSTADGMIVIGRLFNADHACLESRHAKLDHLAPASSSRPFGENVWGNFACFSVQDGDWRVIRDPSGSVPVFQAGSGEDCLFLSDACTARELGLLARPRINRDFAIHWLQYPRLPTSRTGLDHVTELLPGQSLRFNRSQWIEEQAWNPWTYARSATAITDRSEAALRLRTTLLDVVALQARDDHHLLQLSGGLDSSIVAAALHEARIPFEAATFATRSRDGDERRYAATVADHCGAELRQISEADLPSVIECPSAPRFRPGPNPILAILERSMRNAFEASGASCLTDGGGGDNLFCYLSTASPAIDALVAGGIREAYFAIGNIAELTGSNGWQVIQAAAATLLTRQKRTSWREDRRFLLANSCLGGPDEHPWLKAPGSALPGKREHVEAIVNIQHFLERRTDGMTPALHPLLAQPLLELCLSVPSWLWLERGRDRAIAREAFERLVPKIILERRTKGSIQGFFYRSFEQHRPQIADGLLHGELRELTILDLPAVERALHEDWQDDEIQLRLSELMALELWLRSLR